MRHFSRSSGCPGVERQFFELSSAHNCECSRAPAGLPIKDYGAVDIHTLIESSEQQQQQQRAQQCADEVRAHVSLVLAEPVSERTVNGNGGVCVEMLVPQAGQGYDGDGDGFDRAGQGYDTRYVGVELVPQERVQLRTGARVRQLVLNAPVLQVSDEDSLLIARIKEMQRTAGEGVRDDAWVAGRRPYYWHQRDCAARWCLPAGLRPGWVRVLEGYHVESQAETWTLPVVAEVRR